MFYSMIEFTSMPDLLKLIDEKTFIKHLEKIIWKGGESVSPFGSASEGSHSQEIARKEKE